MFNAHQRDYMKYLATLPPEEKCACGWSKRGECFGVCYGYPERGGHPQVECPVCKQMVPLWTHAGKVVGRHKPPGYFGGYYCEDCKGSEMEVR